jgi:trehalose utilization protein
MREQLSYTHKRGSKNIIYTIKLHHEELHNLYSSSNIIRMIKSRRMRWAGNAARMGEKRNAYKILVGKPEEKRPLRRPRSRWVDNNIMDLGEIGWHGLDRSGSG